MIAPHNGIYKYHGVFFSRMKATTRSDHSAISFELQKHWDGKYSCFYRFCFSFKFLDRLEYVCDETWASFGFLDVLFSILEMGLNDLVFRLKVGIKYLFTDFQSTFKQSIKNIRATRLNFTSMTSSMKKI